MMSIATALAALDTQRDNLAANLTTKGVTAANTETLSQLVPKVLDITGGGTPTPVSAKDINFFDYDGTLVASWTLAELTSASALPDNPSHSGLTAQGWNWTLANLKTENRATDVGQMYITDDGKTRLYITIAAQGRMTVPLYWSQTVASGVTIDWGDGSTAQTFTGTGNKNTTHTYAAIGDYVITLKVTSGVLELGNGASPYCVLGATATTGRVYTNMLQKAEIGSSISSIGSYAFNYCCSLASIVVPSSVSSIGSAAFNYCYSLASIVIPSGVSSIGSYAFNYCCSLASIVIPSGVPSIGNNTFACCYSLQSIVIPSSVSSIGNNTFDSCPLASIVIPSGVSSIGTAAFGNCYSLASIVIPSGLSSIGSYAFRYCYSLASIVIPSGVSSIGAGAFNYCAGMAEYHFQITTPPALANTDAFSYIPADCKIYVPTASVADYKAATNWSTFASKIYGE